MTAADRTPQMGDRLRGCDAREDHPGFVAHVDRRGVRFVAGNWQEEWLTDYYPADWLARMVYTYRTDGGPITVEAP